MKLFQIQYFIAFAGVWALGNGILHTIFVLLERRPFERELIRLLIDGLLLCFSGALYFLCCRGIKNGEPLALYVTLSTAVFLLCYCALVFKLIPSFITIAVNAAVLVWTFLRLRSH